MAANGAGVEAQVQRLEDELREAHARVDAVVCALESLGRSPAATESTWAAVREALVPAASALAAGAARLEARVSPSVTACGWRTGSS